MKLKDINWNQVYYFYEVAKNLSMKDATKALDVTISTISDQIKKLETSIGLQLFKRVPRQLILTKEGVGLYNHAKEMFESGRKFLDAVAPDPIGGYSMIVGLKESMINFQLVKFLSTYWDEYAPFGTVSTLRILLNEEIIERIIKGSIDWGITYELPASSPRLSCKMIDTAELFFCCSKRISYKFKNKNDIIRSIPFARSTWDLLLNKMIDNHFSMVDVFPSEQVDIDHKDLYYSLIQKSRLIGVISREMAESPELKDNIEIFSLGKPMTIPYYAIWPKGNEKMIGISKLIKLLSGKIETKSDDSDFQIKLSNVTEDKLNL